MFDMLSIRSRLILMVVLSLGFLTLLADVNLYGQRHATQALASVQAKGVRPMLAIQEIDDQLKEIRFDMAGAVLEVTSYIGARHRLKERRERLPLAWQDFMAGFDPASTAPEEVELVSEIGKQLESIQTLFDTLDAAYGKEDRDAVTEILQQHWPVIHKRLVKPLSQLVPSRVDAVKRTFEASASEGSKLNTLSVLSFLLCGAGLLLIALPLTGSLNRGLANLKSTLVRVAAGDLSAHPDTERKDEFGEMALSLEQTLLQLRSIISGVKDAGDALSSAADHMARELAIVIERGRERAEYMDRAAASIQHMSQAAEEIADGSAAAASASEEARSRAATGDGHMESSILATQRVEAAVGDSAEVIQELSAATDRINEITNTIREIADQTNLLALNAAIEAARAGEQGRGFAVVADEVRKLAERTSASTSDITEMVEAIRGRTSSAVDAMVHVRNEVTDGMRYAQETRAAFDGIVVAAEQVTQLAHRIADATQAQLTASTTTTHDMDRVVSMSAENGSSLVRVGQISEELTSMSGRLQEMIGRFHLG